MPTISCARFGLLAALLALAACASTPQARADIRQIVSTTSFGMCVGYCTTRLEISAAGAVLTRQARGGRGAPDLPDQRFTAPLSAAEWDAFARLAAQADLSALPDVIGCPDCADGGAETLSINGARSITFDFGAPLSEAQPLLTRVRALRARLMPEP
ncbi:MAG: hypothetical protein NVV62_05425 [Terricaulis sp.]|nr:hypothetical protein [Terricaulis sp.]